MSSFRDSGGRERPAMVRHRMPTRFHVQVFDRSQICRRFTSSRPRTGDRSKYRISFDWLRRCFTCRPYTGSSSKTTTKLRPPSAISFNDMECLTLTSTVSELFTRGFDQQLMNVFFFGCSSNARKVQDSEAHAPRCFEPQRGHGLDPAARHIGRGLLRRRRQHVRRAPLRRDAPHQEDLHVAGRPRHQNGAEFARRRRPRSSRRLFRRLDLQTQVPRRHGRFRLERSTHQRGTCPINTP